MGVKGNWNSRIPGVVYKGTCAFNPCPSCGNLKKRVAKLCRTCRKSLGHNYFIGPKEYSANPNDRPGVIYKITNIVNQKVYVGKTTIDADYRWGQHLKNSRAGHNSYLYKAVRKHGASNFVVEVIDSGSSEQELDEKEIKWIAELGSADSSKGYNCTIGGDGRVHTPSSRARQKGVRILSVEAKARLRAVNLGRKHTPESLAKMSAAQRGRKWPPEVVARRAESIRRRWKEDTELCEWRSKTTKERYARMTPEERERENAARKAFYTPEVRAALSIAGRAAVTPEMREKMSAIQRDLWTPEKRATMSVTQQALWGPETRAGWSLEMKSRVTEEIRKKCSKASKDWWDSHPEAKEKMSKRVWSEESRAKISRQVWSEESRDKARAAAFKGWAMRRVG